MNRFRLFCLACSFLGILPMMQGQFLPKAQENYEKYEREDVGRFRAKVDFQLPEPTVIIKQSGVENLDPISLSYLFEDGKDIHIEADPRLDEWIQLHKNINRKIDKVNGYRIQVYSGASRNRAFSLKGSLISRFDDHTTYLDYRSPNYVVRIGDFMEKEDATLFCRTLRENYAGAFVVPDEVKVPKYDPEWDKEVENNQADGLFLPEDDE